MIPFNKGDESCACKGTGFIDHDFGTKEVPRIVRGVCPNCVEFKEATVETLVGRDGEFYHLKDGRVVPDED